jgi:hypothetical protein
MSDVISISVAVCVRMCYVCYCLCVYVVDYFRKVMSGKEELHVVSNSLRHLELCGEKVRHLKQFSIFTVYNMHGDHA